MKNKTGDQKAGDLENDVLVEANRVRWILFSES